MIHRDMTPISRSQDRIIQQIRNNFHCEVIGQSENVMLFAALRTANETIQTDRGYWHDHVMDVWHLIAVSSIEAENLSPLQQWHIPRFSMAQAWANFHDDTNSNRAEPSTMEVMQDLSFERCVCGQWHLKQSKKVDCAVNAGFMAKIREDADILQKARSLVKTEKELHFIEIDELKTQAGHRIEHRSRTMLEAIAFEKFTNNRLSAESFGIFSAYCVYRDFEFSSQLTDVVFDELLESLQIACLSYQSPRLDDILTRVQHALLGHEIWRYGLVAPITRARFDLAFIMNSLTRDQRTTFILMNGIYRAPVFLCLAVIHGFCSLEEFTTVLCSAYQPDSLEEQEVKKAVSYMELFGRFASSLNYRIVLS